ncbi:uncharacterized protein LOC122064811 [Macadamia integrifolia]|uniref:uncharacterized protein LOC122064811 n=1 Tax=Macadamia integrifolia TaxID=60698 RepID=UPI001C4ED37E|nr:uncharacterized protein LOC122064811 [Macadamia integrifolia]
MASCRVCLVGCVFIVAALLHGAAARTTHIVGGSIGWTVPPSGFSYDTWAASQTFAVGDWLFFNFTSTTQEDVAEAMSKSVYDSCITVGIFSTYVSTTNILIASAGEHYYFSTIGQRCQMNQKLTINVSAFNFTSTKDEVAQVFTKADYDSCSMTNNFVTYSFVINSTLIVLIGTPGVEQYYFSTIGCKMNQKVTINVSGSPTSSSSSSSNSYTYSNSSSYSSYSSTSSASALTVGVDFFILLLSTVIASFC